MNLNTTTNNQTNIDNQQLAAFLHDLNLAQRSLTLYPANHPQVTTISNKTMAELKQLLSKRKEITFGVAPEALFFEDQWLDRENPTFRAFALMLSGLGIASIGFKPKLSAAELVRFCQILHNDRQTIEERGGFEQLLERQQINHITLIPIDYAAFQEKEGRSDEIKLTDQDLWGEFLHGLLEDILDLGDSGLHVAPETIAELLNNQLSDTDHQEIPTAVAQGFVAQMLTRPTAESYQNLPNQLGTLIRNLSSDLQPNFLAGCLQALDNKLELAAKLLQQLPTELHKTVIGTKLQQQLAKSPRLVELVAQFAATSAQQSPPEKSPKSALNKEVIRDRLETLFSEEQYELYLPDNYQAALEKVFSNDLSSSLPKEVRKDLKVSLENQPIEQQCCRIIFELLEGPAKVEDEKALQQNLQELSYFFLDTGDFKLLREIYTNWTAYLNSGRSAIDILAEQVLASHTQPLFMQEVLDGIDIWGEDKTSEIADYIAIVGAPYAEAIIERLGSAKQFSRRRYWMKILEQIGTDANQLLVQALSDERWYLVRNLLIIIGKNLAPTTLKAVHRMANHPHPKVRQEVIRVLFSCNPASANRLLLKEFANEQPEIRLNAIKVAEQSRDPEILNFLHEQLQLPVDGESSQQYRRQVLATLSKIGSPETLELFKKRLKRTLLFTTKKQKRDLDDIFDSIGLFPRQAAIETAREIARSHCRYAKQAKTLLKRLGGEPK